MKPMNNKIWDIYEDVSYDLEEDDAFPVEQFAIAIINECIKSIENLVDDHVPTKVKSNSRFSCTIDDLTKTIKNHFTNK